MQWQTTAILLLRGSGMAFTLGTGVVGEKKASG